MKKSICCAVAALLLAQSGVAFASGSAGVAGERASLGLGVSAREGQVGYYVDLRWQFNNYAEVFVGADSFLNGKTYFASKDLAVDLPDDFEEEYGSDAFRPRHNTFNMGLTLRYPFALGQGAYLAPYVSASLVRMSTKDVEFFKKSASGSTGNDGDTNQDAESIVIGFDALGAVKLGTGLQFSSSEAHRWALGVVSYNKDNDWGQLVDGGSEVAASVRYEYKPLAQSFSVALDFESADQFGDPAFRFGINWIFG